jgi:hypothetical protein
MDAIAQAVEKNLFWNTNYLIVESLQYREVAHGYRPSSEQLEQWRLAWSLQGGIPKVRELRDFPNLEERLVLCKVNERSEQYLLNQNHVD